MDGDSAAKTTEQRRLQWVVRNVGGAMTAGGAVAALGAWLGVALDAEAMVAMTPAIAIGVTGFVLSILEPPRL